MHGITVPSCGFTVTAILSNIVSDNSVKIRVVENRDNVVSVTTQA